MTTQLWMWEYEKKTESGHSWSDGFVCTPRFGDPRNLGIRRTSEITDLRPAKVVDADAVVIEGITRDELCFLINPPENPTRQQGIDQFKLWQLFKTQLTPPVTEPKGFGAIVEAKLDGKHRIGGFPVAGRKHLWKLESSGWELINIEGFSALWCWFIDPVVISEGVSNGLR